jgi:hypothetical protein
MTDARSLPHMMPARTTPERNTGAIFPCDRLPRDVSHATRTMTAAIFSGNETFSIKKKTYE